MITRMRSTRPDPGIAAGALDDQRRVCEVGLIIGSRKNLHAVGLMEKRALMVIAGSVAVFGLACSSAVSSVPISDGFIPLGTWGGDSGGMIVGDTAMHLHVACTYGDVSGRIPVSSNGQFDVRGSYVLRAYPITVGPSVPARFIGHVDGSTITVTAIVDDTVEHKTVTRGPVTVKFGDEPRLGPCPICRRPIVTKIR